MPRKLPSFKTNITPMVHTMGDVGALVRNQRARSLLRIDDAAALCFVSSDLMSRLENGKPVGLDKLLLVLDGLGLRMLIAPKADALEICHPSSCHPSSGHPPNSLAPSEAA